MTPRHDPACPWCPHHHHGDGLTAHKATQLALPIPRKHARRAREVRSDSAPDTIHKPRKVRNPR